MSADPIAVALISKMQFPDGMFLALDRLEHLQGRLFPEEQEVILHAVEKRKREFIAGRTVARRALAGLGAEMVAIPFAADRSPCWPDGIAGSLTHDDSYAAAVCAPAEEIRAVGIDIEQTERLTPDLWPLVFSQGECERLQGCPEPEQTLWFCLKEAFFKLQYALTQTVVDYKTLRIEPQPAGDYILRLTLPPVCAGFPESLAPGGELTARGIAAVCDNQVLAIAFLPA